MDANGNDEVKSNMVNDCFEEAKASMEKALKEAKASLEKAENAALEFCNALEPLNLYVSDSDIEDDVHRSSTPSIRRAAVKVEENSTGNKRDARDITKEMLMILLPQYFELEEKSTGNKRE